jgi:histidine triad (HIT) family protein
MANALADEKAQGLMTDRPVSSTTGCGICERVAGSELLWQDSYWAVRHAEAPHGVAGWMTLYAKRHVAGFPFFDDAEARTIGPALRHLERALLEVSGALRIYTASMNESFPHFHCHLVPKYEQTPEDVRGYEVLLLSHGARRGEIVVDIGLVESISQRFKQALNGWRSE